MKYCVIIPCMVFILFAKDLFDSQLISSQNHDMAMISKQVYIFFYQLLLNQVFSVLFLWFSKDALIRASHNSNNSLCSFAFALVFPSCFSVVVLKNR